MKDTLLNWFVKNFVLPNYKDYKKPGVDSHKQRSQK
jgi:hypothetical protein